MKILTYLLLISIFLFSCMNDDLLWENQQLPVIKNPYSGVFIVNEGNFMYNNASLSYYDIESKEVFNDIFFNTNSIPLGDVAQSISIKDSLGYVVINNSGKVYVFNINNFELVGKITGLTSPRHIHFINDSKAYITDLYAKAISIVDLHTLQVTGNIDLNNNSTEFYQHSTEEMIQHNDLIFTNCWSYDNKILVIDTKTDKLVDSVEVPIQPVSMVMDMNKKLWVLCDGGFAGNPYGHGNAALVKINTESLEIEKNIQLGIDDEPKDLKINGSKDTLFFINKDVYFMPISSNANPQILIESSYTSLFGGYYALAVDSVTSDIYVADAIDLTQNGLVYRFKSDATPIDTFSVGIIPGDFCFME